MQTKTKLTSRQRNWCNVSSTGRNLKEFTCPEINLSLSHKVRYWHMYISKMFRFFNMKNWKAFGSKSYNSRPFHLFQLFIQANHNLLDPSELNSTFNFVCIFLKFYKQVVNCIYINMRMKDINLGATFFCFIYVKEINFQCNK